MTELVANPVFWLISFIYFVFLMMAITDGTDVSKWNWKQAALVWVVAGPIAWVLGVIMTILAGFGYLWELLGDKPKKS